MCNALHTLSKSSEDWHAAIEYELNEALRSVLPLLKVVTEFDHTAKEMSYAAVADAIKRTVRCIIGLLAVKLGICFLVVPPSFNLAK